MACYLGVWGMSSPTSNQNSFLMPRLVGGELHFLAENFPSARPSTPEAALVTKIEIYKVGKEKAGWRESGNPGAQTHHIGLADQEAGDSAKTVRLIVVLSVQSVGLVSR